MTKFYPKWRTFRCTNGVVIQATLRTPAGEHKLQMKIDDAVLAEDMASAVTEDVQDMTEALRKIWEIDQ